ncbi:DAO-domain-containing protein [Meredithblackwellia eburnea MCA 4105]
MSHTLSPVIVLGAGCVGLTTAIKLREKGFPVLVLAHHLPGDPLDPTYASPIAGAHHLSFADDNDWRQRHFDGTTFDYLWQESEDEQHAKEIGLMRLVQTEFYSEGEKHLRFMEQMPNFRIHSERERPAFATHCVSFTSLTIDPTFYLPHLVKRLLSLGGVIQRVPLLPSLAAAVAYHPSPLALVNCTGLGARDLHEVQDKTVHPVRGQVILLDAPWVKSGWTRQVGSLAGGEGGERTYIIPRASGDVIIGGTREKDDWLTTPRKETSANIQQRALEICPSLALSQNESSPFSLSSIIKTEVVGFRPTRDGGIRLEKGEHISRVPIVHNYGHGGYGWQSCYGCADEAVKLVGECVRDDVEHTKSKL